MIMVEEMIMEVEVDIHMEGEVTTMVEEGMITVVAEFIWVGVVVEMTMGEEETIMAVEATIEKI